MPVGTKEEPKLYYIIRWKQNMKARGWPRVEVYPMPVRTDKDYEVKEANLTFKEADKKKKELIEELELLDSSKGR